MEEVQLISKTHSTNALLWEMNKQNSLQHGFSIRTHFQIEGKGQLGNKWESEDGMNLLFSMMLHPTKIAADKQFLLSQLVSVAIIRVLEQYTTEITIKWPNDIYWKDKKLGGILIENVLQGKNIKTSVVGIGINVNQQVFTSDAPNPVSLRQIKKAETDVAVLFDEIRTAILQRYQQFNALHIQMEYAAVLYRNEGYHLFSAEQETFSARIMRVESDGRLLLETETGETRAFYFKEVGFVL